MKRNIIVCLILCFIAPFTIEAKKKSLGNGLFWELSDDGILTISGYGAIPDYSYSPKDRNVAPWFKEILNKVKVVVVEDGVTEIGDNAFNGQYYLWYDNHMPSSIVKVILPNSLNRIGDNAFSGTSIREVSIPNTVTSMGIGIFQDCIYLKSFKCPTNWKIIPNWTFAGCKSLFEVTLAEGIEEIGYKAFGQTFFSFYNCKCSLEKIHFPNSLKKIGDDAFAYTSLHEIRLPNLLEEIGKGAFSSTLLHEIVLPNSLIKIGEYAFYGCKLKKVEIPNSVKSIGANSFFQGDNVLFQGTITLFPIDKLNKYSSSEIENRIGLSVPSLEAYKKGAHDKNGKLLLASKDGRTITKKEGVSQIYYIVVETGKIGLLGIDGKWIVPLNDRYSKLELINDYFIKVIDNYHKAGVITVDGKEIIPTSRGYTSISDFNNSNKTFTFTKKGFSGVCNERGEEISTTRLAPTSDDIKADGGYASAVELKNGNTKYYKVSKGGRYGLTDAEGKVIVPTEMEALESAGNGYLRYKLNGFWGLMNYAGKIIIDTDRGYTSIGDFKTFNKRFPYTMTGYKGECDVTGKQISKIKVETPPQQTVAKQESTPKKEEKKVEEIIIKHDPVPMQVWKQCTICYGSGKCQTCGGTGIFTGWSGNKTICEYGCGGSGKCSFCAGHGGHYEVEYK